MKFHFKFKEMCYSGRAEQLGMENCPTEFEILDNLLNTMRELERVRNIFGKPIVVTSGYRSPELNPLVGGAENSQHMKGEAADISASSKADNKDLLGIIRTFCHYDQLIDYTNDKGQIQWIHVSFKREGKNRNEWLHKKA